MEPKVIICLLFICLPPAEPAPVVIDNYANQCEILSISKSDTPQTQRNLARTNARCKAAREVRKK